MARQKSKSVKAEKAAKRQSGTSGKKPSGAKEAGGDTGLVRELAEILRETDLTDIEVERQGLRIRVTRQTTVMSGPFLQPPYVPIASQSLSLAPTSQAADTAKAVVTIGEKGAHPGAVTSPMVGTAYVAASPGSDPFVKKGDQVKEGQTLLIIEAMKTMNQIPAPRSGRVLEILFADGQPVEFGEALMIIE